MSTTVKWGLITGMVSVFFGLISNMLGLSEQGEFSGMSWLMLVLSLGGTFYTIYLGIKETKEEKFGGYLTVGQGFKTGMGIALIASVIGFAFSLIYLNLIDPGMVGRIADIQEQQLEQKGMSEEQLEAARSMSGMFMNAWFFSLMGIVFSLFWGLIQSLIAASILKKEAPPTLHDDTPTAPVA